MQFDFSLSGEHGFFYDSGASRNRRLAAGLRGGKANAGRGAEILPKSSGALRPGIAALRERAESRRPGRKLYGSDDNGEGGPAEIPGQENYRGVALLRFTELASRAPRTAPPSSALLLPATRLLQS